MDIGLVGIGGYGEVYLRALLGSSPSQDVKLVAGIDPQPQRCSQYSAVEERHIPLFTSLEEMYESGIRPELVILASPLHLHADQSIVAMENGSHVLCEKPIAALPEDAARMIATRDKTGRVLAVGFQWAFAREMRRLKADILAKRFGDPVAMRTKVYWPRPRSYYSRNGWAGRVATIDGKPVFDSPVNNACAHFIHNMVHLIMDERSEMDWPSVVSAELYRANDIENYDTAVFKCKTSKGVQIFSAVSHATQETLEPTFEYTFHHARVISDLTTGGNIIAFLENGEQIDYGAQPTGFDIEKLWSTVSAIRAGEMPPCSAESAAAHTALAAAIQQSCDVVTINPSSLSNSDDKRSVFVPGLGELLDHCYAKQRLPSDFGISWARRGREVQVEKAIGMPTFDLRLEYA